MKQVQLAEGKWFPQLRPSLGQTLYNAPPLFQENAEDTRLLRNKPVVLPGPPAHHPSGRKELGVPLEQEASLKINCLLGPSFLALAEDRVAFLFAAPLTGLLSTQRLAPCSVLCAHHVTTNSQDSSEAQCEQT